jgi:hypothetical protein
VDYDEDGIPDRTFKIGDVVAWDNPFGDLNEDDRFYADVIYARENEIMNGVSAARFDPGAPMSRAMLVTALRAAGVLSGRPGGFFDPRGDATRAEVAAVPHRYRETIFSVSNPVAWVKISRTAPQT